MMDTDADLPKHAQQPVIDGSKDAGHDGRVEKSGAVRKREGKTEEKNERLVRTTISQKNVIRVSSKIVLLIVWSMFVRDSAISQPRLSFLPPSIG